MRHFITVIQNMKKKGPNFLNNFFITGANKSLKEKK